MLASSGMRTAFRLVTQSAHNGSKRGIHIPRRPPPLPASGGPNILNQVRNVLNRLIYGVSNPGSHAHNFARTIHLSQPIRSQLSLPARHLVSRPFGTPTLPRAPTVQRGITQVGLGTARNFGTARPIFQSLAIRAMYEADLDVDKKKGRRLHGRKVKKTKSDKKTKEMSKQREEFSSFESYFAELPPSEVKTILTVPLYPASSDAGVEPEFAGSFIPVRAVSHTHSAHSTHAIRISSLFLRLDQARVWENGAHYEAFGVQDRPFDPGTALCTSLRIVFDGWTIEQVRTVIGEAGKGWCTMREERKTVNAPVSLESSRATTPAPSIVSLFDINQESLVNDFEMPTLDFSSSFLETRAAPTFRDMTTSPIESPVLACISLPSTRAASVFGDNESDYEWHWSSNNSSRPKTPEEPVLRQQLAFSAQFMSRGQDMASNI